jgi:SAM-dependent methyltransferase
MSTDRRIVEHHTHGSLEKAILDALLAAGKDPDRLNLTDLAPVDEFHIGGRQATIDFAEQLGAARGASLLDIGSGLGGASRYFAHALGCRVAGIDLTDEYVRVAAVLATWTGLGALVSYTQGSALALPFEVGTFDGAYMLHVGMNIADKPKLFAEVRRVSKPSGLFGIYDVMRERDGNLIYPVPWAEAPRRASSRPQPRIGAGSWPRGSRSSGNGAVVSLRSSSSASCARDSRRAASLRWASTSSWARHLRRRSPT